LHKARAELAHVTRVTALGELTASIAHEIKQPLAAIVLNGDASLRWLSHTPPNVEEARAALSSIVRDGLRTADVITNIRAIFRKGDEARAALNVNELVREILGLTQGEIQDGRVVVRTELADGLPGVLGNRVQLQLVLRNLITNAVEAMSAVKGRARVLGITTQRTPSGVWIAVADSGTGIDPDNVGRVFDTFFTTKSYGMGMGLSISRSIVEAHGGRLSASSAQPHGSMFEVVLPPADGVIE